MIKALTWMHLIKLKLLMKELLESIPNLKMLLQK